MLANLKRLLLLAILLLLGIAVLIFVLQNRQPAHLVLLGWTTSELPVAVLLSASFILGVLLSLLGSLWLIGRLRLRISRQQRELMNLRPRDGN
ncbi:lipopolysaccharide assembly protein LapA domain-containing protein [Aquipseudomonas ullengensis]|uniref:lipopolysaccharide assembly protein LapA domain-containing protein n=1 Tax=Aquipseudomonas ullengensis TaxID=2759166 RepID=UPI001F47691B|nr:lipopolysaccharide assembly protein LapA domain-containing protein [Pseudomonas ullengensis]